MGDVLARIVARKRAEVAARPVVATPTPTRRSLRAALARPGARFVMEAKLRSPSGHVARHALEEAVSAYAPIADAVSILTDEADFGGALSDVARARALFDGPILAKDFVVDARQVAEARGAGADAVLVMLSVLDDTAATTIVEAASALGMDALVEVHDEKELARALALGATLIGINNRDLKTLATDLAVTERLAPLVPPGVVLVSESGIARRRDVQRLAGQVDAFLVGSSLMRADRIEEAARALVHGRVKLCGLTRAADVAVAAAAGATHAGFILVPGTPRALTVAQAAPLVDQARASGLRTVGVFRDCDTATIVSSAEAVPFDCIQYHGADAGAVAVALQAALFDREIVVARGVENGAVSAPAAGARPLFDTAQYGLSGGSGRSFDWVLVADEPDLSDAFVAGGIGPANAAAAASLGAYGLDIGSGVESAPGLKDPEKVRALFAALRPACRSDR